ncbi:hypothetical protein [Halobaculum sp. P14]|uniref:hypothetical protein n=1 Tax=Halobaculum sp. P14 TaxID=3421638 RepID=UPI003EC0915F
MTGHRPGTDGAQTCDADDDCTEPVEYQFTRDRGCVSQTEFYCETHAYALDDRGLSRLTVADGGSAQRDATTYSVAEARTVAYGPLGFEGAPWVLRFQTETAGRVSVRFDETAMYELWTEVHNVPWPGGRPETRSDLQREVVALAEGADEEMLQDAVAALGGESA